MKFNVVLEKERDGRYSIHCPAIKGCHTYGNTKTEALKNMREAIQGCLEALNEKIKTQKFKNGDIYKIAV